MTVPEDEDAIEALTPERAHEPLRERVRSRCLDRGANDPWPLGAEHLVEAAHVFGVTVADEEAEGTAVPPGDEGARLLADPGGVGIGGDAREVHPAGCDLDEKEHIETMQEHGVHGQKVARDDASSLGPRELPPGRSRPPRGRSIPCARSIDHTVLGAIAISSCLS